MQKLGVAHVGERVMLANLAKAKQSKLGLIFVHLYVHVTIYY